MGHPSERGDEKYDFLIIGAGPAGTQSAYYLEKLGRKYVVLEAGPGPCTFFTEYPRHRQLISINKRFNGFPEDDFNMRHDWNSLLSDDPEMRFTKYSDELFPPADVLVKYTKDFVEKFNLNMKYNAKVCRISRLAPSTPGSLGDFSVKTEAGEVLQAPIVIMGLGAMKEKLPDIPGVELAETYAKHDITQSKYEDHEVCVVGGGNSGFETADHLSGHAAVVHVLNSSPFKLAWDTHFPGNLRAINNSIIDMFHLKSLHAVRIGHIKKIEKVEDMGKDRLKIHYDMPLAHWNPPCTAHLWGIYDDIILCTGWKYVAEEMFDMDCCPETTPCGKFATLNSSWESTNVKNLYFVGTCTQQRDRRAASSFIHGFRYSARSLMYLLNHIKFNVPLPMETFNSIDMSQITEFMIKRFSTTSALYQLNYGVLCDIMMLRPNFEKANLEDGTSFAGSVKYYYELPMAWALEQDTFTSEEEMWICILKDHRSSFPANMPATDFASPPDIKISNQPCTGFIGPIIYRYKKGVLIEEFNLGGNLIVRSDQNQLPGDNNPNRAANKIKNLLMKQLDISGSLFDESLYSEKMYSEMYTHWDSARIEKERQGREMCEAMRTCSFTPVVPEEI